MQLDEAGVQSLLKRADRGVNHTVPIMNVEAHVVAFCHHLIYHSDFDTLASSYTRNPHEPLDLRVSFGFFGDEVCLNPCNELGEL